MPSMGSRLAARRRGIFHKECLPGLRASCFLESTCVGSIRPSEARQRCTRKAPFLP